MSKEFNTTAVCRPEEHYMVNIEGRLKEIKSLVDAGKYFTINRARQYGKTTILRALNKYLQEDYYVISMDFQVFSAEYFKTETMFVNAFIRVFLRLLKKTECFQLKNLIKVINQLNTDIELKKDKFLLLDLFEYLSDICAEIDKPMILLIDEVDSATNNQVFLDFLAQFRAYYINRDIQPTFQSVILAGVYDVKNLKRKLRPEEEHKVNSPWNIATEFKVEMSFSTQDIVGMLEEYENDYHTGMQIEEMAQLLYDYTSGYPFLVSKLCKLMDEDISLEKDSKSTAWTKQGFNEAIKILLEEKNTLFESLIQKLENFPELNSMLHSLLFTGKNIVYNSFEPSIEIAAMFGFIKNQSGALVIANRIFETWLYNLYLTSSEIKGCDIHKASLLDKNQFLIDGKLNMQLVLEKFAIHFNDLYGDCNESFLEEEGRRYFLLYLRPIINGIGNYYVEARTRDFRRTDVIVDYKGEQFIIEMKIWHGDEYNNRGEQQLAEYLDYYHQRKGYLLSFNFNKKKQVGIHKIVIGNKTLIEAVV